MPYYTPSFNGEFIFGVAVQMKIVDPPRRRQFNQFVGINGTECLDFGSTMRQVHAQGRLTGSNQDELAAKMMYFMSYKNDLAYLLTTTQGIYFSAAILHEFQQTSKVWVDLSTGQASQDYRCTFLDLNG